MHLLIETSCWHGASKVVYWKIHISTVKVLRFAGLSHEGDALRDAFLSLTVTSIIEYDCNHIVLVSYVDRT